MASLFDVLNVAIPLALMVGLPIAGVMFFARLMTVSDLENPVCRRCRYPAVHLPSHICPECGSDLNIVGVVEARRHVWWTFTWRFGALGLAVYFVVYIVPTVLAPVMPVYVQSESHVLLSPTTAEVDYAFRISSEDSRWKNRQSSRPVPRPESIVIEFQQKSVGHSSVVTSRLEIDQLAPAVVIENADGRRELLGAVTREGLLDWVRSLPIELEDARASAHANELMTAISLDVDPAAVSAALTSPFTEPPSGRTDIAQYHWITGGHASKRIADSLFLLLGGGTALVIWTWLVYRFIRRVGFTCEVLKQSRLDSGICRMKP